MKRVTGIPTATISRLVTYLRTLEWAEANLHHRTPRRDGAYYIGSTEIAERSGNSAFQVRKDLAHVLRAFPDKHLSASDSFGTRGVGYKIVILKRELKRVLGLNETWNVVIVGVGRLGQAIANYPGASEYHFEYVGLFDVSPDLVGQSVRGLPVRHVDDLRAFTRTTRVDMGFLAVPPERAQDAAQRLADAGVRGVLNFAPTVIQPLTVERGGDPGAGEERREVTIENVDFLAGMKRLAFYIQNPHLSTAETEDDE